MWWITRAVSTLSTWWDKWIIDGVCVNAGDFGAYALVSRGLFEWGLVQWYALVMIAGYLIWCVLRMEVKRLTGCSY